MSKSLSFEKIEKTSSSRDEYPPPPPPVIKTTPKPSAPPLIIEKNMKKKKQQPSFASAMRNVFSLVYPEKGTLMLSLSALTLCSAINLAIPTLLGKAVNRMIRKKKSGEVNGKRNDLSDRSFGILCFGVICVGSFASFVRTYTIGIANQNISMRLRKRLFKVSLRKRRDEFDTTVPASVSMLSSQTDKIATVATNTCSNLLRGLSSVVGGTFMLLRISPQLTVAAVSIVPLIGATAMFQSLGKKERSGELQRRIDDTNAWADERLHHVKTVKLFHREEFEEKSYGDLVKKQRDVAVSNARSDGVFMGTLNMTLTASLSALLLFGGYLQRKGKVTAGNLTAFGMHTLWLGLGTASLISIRKKLIEASDSFEQILNQTLKIDVKEDRRLQEEEEKQKKVVDCKGDIEFCDVSYRYPTRPDHEVLRGFNLRIKGGSKIVLVGASGSGKSTIVDLLGLFARPQEGFILLNGVEISKIRDYRDKIGIVSQRPVLWNTSIRENIRYGDLTASDEDVERAARAAGIMDFVKSLKNGMDTAVGSDDSSTISGGQLARVAIARALIKDPCILIFDEAFSSLDGRTKSQVLSEIISSSEKNNRTLIFITHDTSILSSVETVVVLENGVNVDQGTYRRLSTSESGALERAMLLFGGSSSSIISGDGSSSSISNNK